MRKILKKSINVNIEPINLYIYVFHIRFTVNYIY